MLCLYLCPVDQRKTRQAADNAEVNPDVAKPSENEDKKPEEKSSQAKKEDQTDEKKMPAVETKTFNVRAVSVSVSVCVIYS